MATDVQIIDLTPDNIADYGVCGYKDARKHPGLKRKLEWFAKYYPKGLRIKAVISESSGCQGMLEYIPGEYAHRPVSAEGYLFIHCLFVGFKKEFKGKGYASMLLDACVEEAKRAMMKGVAVVTRDGSFMANKDIFLKKGFEQAAEAKPDFQLLALKFSPEAENPGFKEMSLREYADGLTIMRSSQCPYSDKNVDEIIQTAKKMGLEPRLVELDDAEAAQRSPCAFGTFCVIYDGVILSHHPISNGRFENIMNKTLPR